MRVEGWGGGGEYSTPCLDSDREPCLGNLISQPCITTQEILITQRPNGQMKRYPEYQPGRQVPIGRFGVHHQETVQFDNSLGMTLMGFIRCHSSMHIIDL